MDAPLKTMYSLLALVRVNNLSLPGYKPESSCVRFFKTRKFQAHSLLHFFTIPDRLNVKFRCSLIGPKVRNFEYVNPSDFHLCNVVPLSSTVWNPSRVLLISFSVQECLTLQVFPASLRCPKLSMFTTSVFFTPSLIHEFWHWQISKLSARYTRHKTLCPCKLQYWLSTISPPS